MRYIVLAGPHGVGKSSLTDALSDALRAKGIGAMPLHHVRPSWRDPTAEPYARIVPVNDPIHDALDYATQRRRFVLSMSLASRETFVGKRMESKVPVTVAVCDRWVESSIVLSRAALDRVVSAALCVIADAENEYGPSVQTILLDASDEELDARAVVRGTPTTHTERMERGFVRELATQHGWPVVRTDRPYDDVLRDLAETATRMIG